MTTIGDLMDDFEQRRAGEDIDTRKFQQGSKPPMSEKRDALIALLNGWSSPSMRPFNDRLADAILDLLSKP